jgi:hypothetical protein
LDLHRRQIQGGADVLEAVCHPIFGQHFGHADADAEQHLFERFAVTDEPLDGTCPAA